MQVCISSDVSGWRKPPLGVGPPASLPALFTQIMCYVPWLVRNAFRPPMGPVTLSLHDMALSLPAYLAAAYLGRYLDSLWGREERNDRCYEHI